MVPMPPVFGPLSAVEGRLVVHGRHQGQDLGPVGDDDEGDLPAAQELLDEQPVGRRSRTGARP